LFHGTPAPAAIGCTRCRTFVGERQSRLTIALRGTADRLARPCASRTGSPSTARVASAFRAAHLGRSPRQFRVGPARGSDAPAQVIERGLGHVDGERPDRAIRGLSMAPAKMEVVWNDDNGGDRRGGQRRLSPSRLAIQRRGASHRQSRGVRRARAPRRVRARLIDWSGVPDGTLATLHVPGLDAKALVAEIASQLGPPRVAVVDPHIPRRLARSRPTSWSRSSPDGSRGQPAPSRSAHRRVRLRAKTSLVAGVLAVENGFLAPRRGAQARPQCGSESRGVHRTACQDHVLSEVE
jgi:hypothetical protein